MIVLKRRSMNIIVRIVFVLLTVVIVGIAAGSLAGQSESSGEIPDSDGKTGESHGRIRNVVLISIDTCRADRLGCYGYRRKTSPNIDAVAAEGVIFEHAVTSVPITLPSHSSMLTGTIPLYHRVRDNNNYRLDSSNITLAEILRDNGFATGAIIGAFVLDSLFGLDQGFDSYEDDIEEKKDEPRVYYNERKAEEVTRLANIWLEDHRGDEFFLFLHYFDPHAPYVKHKRFALPFVKYLYDGEIAYTDRCIGQVINKLKDLNLYDSTLLIITADHGESLGQHSEQTHGFFIYHSTLHVPLIFKVPGGPKGRRIESLAGLIDIVPTVCGLLGIEAPGCVQGKDLSASFSTASTPDKSQRFLYCESLMATKFDIGPLLGLVNNRWKYIYTAEPELYDLAKNRSETKNMLQRQAEQAGIMQNQLRSILEKSNVNTIPAGKVTLDAQTRNRLESLGYIAESTVDENIQVEQKGTNPKELIELYNCFEEMLGLVAAGKYGKAKKACNKMVKKWPKMKQAHFQLGRIALLEKDVDGIITHFSRYLADEQAEPNDAGTLQTAPQYASAHSNVGTALASKGKFDEAIVHHKKALAYRSYVPKYWHNLGGVYLQQGRFSEALACFVKALELDPELADAHFFAARIFHKQGKLEQAITHYGHALRLRPDAEQAQIGLNMARAQKQKLDAWNKSSSKPDEAAMHNKLGTAAHQHNNIERAIEHWNKALELKGDWPDVLNNLAWVRAVYENTTFYDPNEAVQFARRACELTGFEQPMFLDTLAITYAAAGKFPEAIKIAEKAIELAQASQQAELTDQIRNRLLLYKASQPYVERLLSHGSVLPTK